MKPCGFRIPATIYRFIVSSKSHGCCSRPCVGLAIREVIDVDEEISTEFCYTFRVQNPEKISPAKEVRKLMRIQVQRCHAVYCQNGTKLIVIPFLASRSQTLSVFLFGYHAPEYAMTGQLNAKSDVYSFGVVQLELLTGRKPVDHTLPRGQQSLVTWATPRLSEHKVKQCVDPRLNSEYPPKAIEKMAAVAALCVQFEADFRPNMSIVVKALQPLLNT